MRYISEAERKAASQMTWSEILTHVKQAEQCEEPEVVRRQIGNAIQDGELPVRWVDEHSLWGTPSGISVPDDRPPRDADYWLECEIDPNDPNRVREPPPYDRGLVSQRRTKQLDKLRRFRAPWFPRQLALKLWRRSRGSPTAAMEKKAKTFLANLLRANPDMKRNDGLTACRREFQNLSERGFKERVWPDARAEAKLERRGRPGAKTRTQTS